MVLAIATHFGVCVSCAGRREVHLVVHWGDFWTPSWPAPEGCDWTDSEERDVGRVSCPGMPQLWDTPAWTTNCVSCNWSTVYGWYTHSLEYYSFICPLPLTIAAYSRIAAHCKCGLSLFIRSKKTVWFFWETGKKPTKEQWPKIAFT